MVFLKPTATTLTILLTLQVTLGTAHAAGSCSVTALDTVAGLGTEISVNSCAASASLALTMTQPSGQEYSQTVVTDAAGSATTLIPSKFTVTAGTYTVTVGGEEATFSVLADRPDDARSSLILSKKTLRSDGEDALTVTAVLRDRYDNPVSGRPLALISGRLGDDITPQSKQTDDEGRFLWIVRSTEPGTITLMPYDILSSRQLKMRAEVTVGNGGGAVLRGSLVDTAIGGSIADLTPALVDHFELELPQGAVDVKANELFTLTIRAMRGQEVVRGYVGTLIVSSSDPDADLPKKGDDPKSPTTGRIDIRAVDQGQRKVPLAFVLRLTGKQTIAVQDKEEPTITGEITMNVGGGGPSAGMITVLDPVDRSRVKGATSILLQGKAPSLINLKVKGGGEEVTGETDEEGVFRIDVPLNPADKEVTLFVQSENGSYESEPVHIIIDNDAPVIGLMSLDPVEGKAGELSTLTVHTEADLASVVATVQDKALTLTGSGGVYTGAIAAPPEPGTYTVSVTATDSVGNASSKDLQWSVTSKTIPVVEDVQAESRPLEIFLTWKAITAVPVSEYKIYIAKEEDPQNYLYSISTKKPVTSASIKDLPLGATYQLSLTAMNPGGVESIEKSAPVSASPLGMSLTAKPGKDSVLLEWTPMPSLPLDHYTLEYGVEEGQYPEKRTIDGTALSTVVHDLIGGVTYVFRLTPTTVTGKTMPELAATADATVGGGSFETGPADPVPTEIIGWTHSGAALFPPPATTNEEIPQFEEIPENTSSGIPSTVVWSIVLIGGFVTFLQWRRYAREQLATRAFFESMQHRYRS